MLPQTRLLAAQLLAHAARGREARLGPRLLIVAGPDAGRSLPVGAGDVVGRSEAAQVALRDPAASRRHVRIERRDARLAIVDLGSKNGVELNGRRLVAHAPLHDGDRLRIGTTVLEAAGFLAETSSSEVAEACAAEDAEQAGRASPSARPLRLGAAMLLLSGVALAVACL